MSRSQIRHVSVLDAPARVRWRADDARAVLQRLKASGLTVGEFAAREGLDPQRLYRWRAQLGSENRADAEFVEITPAAVHGSIELTLRSGDVLRVPDTFSENALRRVLAVLDERAARC